MSDINQHTPNKHAYLIIAHTNWNQLNKLVRVLDDLRNDLYIHIDQKSLISFNKTGGWKRDILMCMSSTVLM